MDPISDKIVRAGLTRLESLKAEEIRISNEIKVLIQSIQESCCHPEEMLVEGKHESLTWCSYAKPPFRVCRLCGCSEPDWGCGYFQLAPNNYNISQMSRDEAQKFIKGGLMKQEQKMSYFIPGGPEKMSHWTPRKNWMMLKLQQTDDRRNAHAG